MIEIDVYLDMVHKKYFSGTVLRCGSDKVSSDDEIINGECDYPLIRLSLSEQDKYGTLLDLNMITGYMIIDQDKIEEWEIDDYEMQIIEAMLDKLKLEQEKIQTGLDVLTEEYKGRFAM